MFSSEMEVEITHDGEDVTIYYTTDGWETTQSGASPVAFTVTTTTTVEAYAAHANYVDSEKVSATYTYKERRTFAHTTEVWTGVDYVIMSSDAGASSFYLMGPEDTDNSRITALSSSDFELSDNKLEVTIEPTVDYQIVRFENNGDGTYYMYSVNYGKYFNGAGKGKAGFSADPEAVTIDCTTAQTNVTDMYWAKIIWQGTDHTGYYLQKNDQNMFFGCYENTQRNLYLYIDAASASKVMDPKFYKSDCTVPLGFSMNVTCGTPDASIEWTFTDAEGNALNITPWYVDGEGWYFTVSEAMTVTAKGVKEGLDDSEVISTTYNVIDLAAEPRYFKRVASMDDIEEGIANNREFIVGAYSRFYLSQEGAARPGLMSIAEKAQTSETFKLWAAPKQSTTWGVTNFVLIGEENGKVDDGDDEIQVNNNGIMAMRSADATDDDFKSLAFITIEHYTGEDRKDFKNHEIDSSVQLYTFKIGDKYLNGSTGQGSGNNTLYWSDEQVPMMLSMITSTEDIPETQDYLVDRMLCQWIKTTDDRETEYKCLKYNYGTDISVYGSYQHSNTGNDQVYPFIYVEEDYESVKCPEPLYKEFDTQQENNYTYNITFKDEKEIPAYIWVYMEGQESKCTDTPASSDSGSSETSKRPKAVSYDNDHAVISVTVNLHGKHEGGVHTFTSKVGEPVKVPIYVTSTVKATAAYDGYLASRSGEAINEVSVLDQTPTGIVEVGVDEIETGARVFNLQGQMLPRPVKGQVVIVAPLSAPAYKALLR
ncbi:MAG: chitobiase/beta-hexosaminidase C-terminal domain-containing protein [Bacteroidales bacterium]|nr:chitobiase/beta-hexosaminidase C-terminal domain-containing protein [Bacteroidales bacterium]